MSLFGCLAGSPFILKLADYLNPTLAGFLFLVALILVAAQVTQAASNSLGDLRQLANAKDDEDNHQDYSYLKPAEPHSPSS